MVLACSNSSPLRIFDSRRAWLMPKMPFIGVLSSWLILERNSPLAVLAFSASFLARINSLTKGLILIFLKIRKMNRKITVMAND